MWTAIAAVRFNALTTAVDSGLTADGSIV